MSNSSSSPFEAGSVGLHHSYSRKQKSLGLLCSNFMTMYNNQGVDSVGLDDAAARLGVERRRIYDIVNVLESIGVLARKAKNQYSWIGFSGIPKALEMLKGNALKENFGAESASFRSDDLDDDDDDKALDHGGDSCIKTKQGSDNRREKSLGMLTENFVKLFLTTNAETVSLDDAARVLLGDIRDPNHMKTKVRRLYDIANVLTSLNLIEKTQQVDTRKPAFRWLGLNGKQDNGVTVVVQQCQNKGTKRQFGVDITNAESIKRSKVVSFGEKQPVKVQMRSEGTKECSQTVQKQSQDPKGYVFGPFTPVGTVMGGNGDDERRQWGQDWETLTDAHRPEYQNQALGDLFAHYMEAWKRWYVEVVQASKCA